MAFRTWARILSAALCVGALAGAGQLGVAYGLRLVRMARTFDVTVRDQWVAQLTWICWMAMVAAIVGAVAAGRLATRAGRPPAGGTAALLAIVAAVGASAVAPLTMLPARGTQAAGLDPVLGVALCAGLGAIIGAMAGYVALAHPVARWNLGAVIGTVWVIGAGCVLASIAQSDPPPVRLGVLDAGSLATTQRAALLTMPALALIAGAALGWVARRQGRALLTVGLAGLPGPALLTLSYLIAGPGDSRYQQVPYWAAMLAAGAGSLGSVLAAVIGRDDERSPAPDTLLPDDPAADDPTADDPTADDRTADDPTADDRLRPDSDRDTAIQVGSPATGGPATGGPATGSPATGSPPGAGPPAGYRETGDPVRPAPLPPPPPWPTDAPEAGDPTARRQPRDEGRDGPEFGGRDPGSPSPWRRAARGGDDRAGRPTAGGGRPGTAPSPAAPAPPTPQQVSPPLPTPTPSSAPLPPPRPTDRHPGAMSARPTGDPRRVSPGEQTSGEPGAPTGSGPGTQSGSGSGAPTGSGSGRQSGSGSGRQSGREPDKQSGKGIGPKDEEYVQWVSRLNDDD